MSDRLDFGLTSSIVTNGGQEGMISPSILEQERWIVATGRPNRANGRWNVASSPVGLSPEGSDLPGRRIIITSDFSLLKEEVDEGREGMVDCHDGPLSRYNQPPVLRAVWIMCSDDASLATERGARRQGDPG